MRYIYGMWWYLYHQSGIRLSLAERQSLHRVLRPIHTDGTVADYRVRSLMMIARVFPEAPSVSACLRDLSLSEWQGRWYHATWHTPRSMCAFYHDSDTGIKYYPLPARCRMCGHEFLGREAITALSLVNTVCFWCSGRLQPLPRYADLTNHPEQLAFISMKSFYDPLP